MFYKDIEDCLKYIHKSDHTAVQSKQNVGAGELVVNFHRLIEGLLFQKLGRGVLRKTKDVTLKKQTEYQCCPKSQMLY